MFDTLNHEIILKHYILYGISGVAIDWYNNYLTNRIQFVELDHNINIHYDPGNISRQVCPRGPFLPPVVSNLYERPPKCQ